MDGLVATTGKLQVFPNAGNVIPGEVRAGLDVRHSCDATRIAAVLRLRNVAEEIATERSLGIAFEELVNQNAVPMSEHLVALIEKAMHRMGEVSRRMVSGAGHDAMVMAAKIPSVMLFIRSVGGISHHRGRSCAPRRCRQSNSRGLFGAERSGRRAKADRLNYLGHTRSGLKSDHLLQTPDTFVRRPLPGMLRANAIIHCGPALGAKFTQYTAEMEEGGVLGPASGQRFVYVMVGSAAIEMGHTQHDAEAGAFAYLSKDCEHRVTAKTEARLAVIEKRYAPISGIANPTPLVGIESSVLTQPLMGDEALQVRSLLPNDMAFDFAGNTMTYQPGASLSMVEVHVMEHGLLKLEGGGIYRLGECWYPVQAGDFIWMRAFCPQWFGAWQKPFEVPYLQRLEPSGAGVSGCKLKSIPTVSAGSWSSVPTSRMLPRRPSPEFFSVLLTWKRGLG